MVQIFPRHLPAAGPARSATIKGTRPAGSGSSSRAEDGAATVAARRCHMKIRWAYTFTKPHPINFAVAEREEGVETSFTVAGMLCDSL